MLSSVKGPNTIDHPNGLTTTYSYYIYTDTPVAFNLQSVKDANNQTWLANDYNDIKDNKVDEQDYGGEE